MAMTLDGSNGVTFNDSSLQGAAASPYVLKNRIINGDMRIDQRNAGASVTPTNGQFLVDRWLYISSQASKFTAQQNAGSINPPTGFTNYLGFTVASAVSIGASDYFSVYQNIEGFNTADLAWGTANAKTVTLSFQVYSSLTGTFGGTIFNGASNRAYPFTYSIPVANTWTTISITIPGDTTGTWTTNNTTGVGVRFGLGVGSTYSATAGSWGAGNIVSATGATSVVGTNGATFYITGVQLEIGTTATPFERRLYNQELANCQRYYQQIGQSNNVEYQPYSIGWVGSSTLARAIISLPVTMRGIPSFTFNNATNTLISGGTAVTSISIDVASVSTVMYNINVASGLTTNDATRHYQNGANTSSLTLSAEL